jgi:hypothetical protein
MPFFRNGALCALILSSILTFGQQPVLRNSDSEHAWLIGTWTDTSRWDVWHSHPKDIRQVTVDNDTLLIATGTEGMSTTYQIMSWRVERDSIIARELQILGVDWNVGYAHYHYKHRGVEVRMPLTMFRRGQSVSAFPHERVSHLIKSSEDSSVDFDEIVSRWRKKSDFRTD